MEILIKLSVYAVYTEGGTKKDTLSFPYASKDLPTKEFLEECVSKSIDQIQSTLTPSTGVKFSRIELKTITIRNPHHEPV